MKKASILFIVVGVVVAVIYLWSPTPANKQAHTSVTVTEGTPTLDGVESNGEWTSDSITTRRGLTIKAMIDNDNFYVLAQWADSTKSLGKEQWTFDGSVWSQAKDEDRVAFVWDMGLNGDEGASCTAMCHSPEHRSLEDNGRVDVWHWKAHRFNPMGFGDDKWWSTDGRHGDAGTGSGSGVNISEGKVPAFMAATDPGANVDFLTENQATHTAFDPLGVLPGSVDVKVAFDADAAFSAGDVIPGRVLTIPTGNRASVHTAGKWASGVWTVEFSRKLAGETGPDGQPEDFQVVRGGSVQFTTEVFDNVIDQSQHSVLGSGFDSTVYTLNFPAE